MALRPSILAVAHRLNTAAVVAAVRSGDLAGAEVAFASTRVKTTATYNCLLAGYARATGPGRLADARHLFDRIPQPDAVTYNTLLSCHFANGDVDGARRLFSEMPIRDVTSWNTMVSGLSKNGALEEAKAVFQGMPVRNAVSWNAMVAGFACSGDGHGGGVVQECASEGECCSLDRHGVRVHG